MGLGFSFGAKDAGLAGSLSQISDKLAGISSAMAKLQPATSAAINPMASLGASIGGGNFGAAAEGLNDVGDAAKGMGTDAKKGGGVFHRMAERTFAKMGDLDSAAGFLTSSLGGVWGQVAVGVASLGGLATSMVRMPFDSMGRAIQGATGHMELMNSLETEAFQNSLDSRRTGANFGYTGAALTDFTRRAAGMASALAIGTEETARAVRAFDEAGAEMAAMGFASANEVARFTSAFGVSADLLRDTGMQMTREFGLSTDQIGRLVSSVTAYGQVSGDVAGSLGGLPAMMETLRLQASRMGVELDSERLTDFAIQSQGLAAGLFQMGQGADGAREGASQLFASLVESQANFQNMFAGTADDLDSFIQEVAIAGGDVGGAFELMQSGPAGFVTGMTRMVSEARKTGGLTSQQFDFVAARLGAALGPEQAGRMVNFFRTADDATLATMANVQTATRDLGSLGREAFRVNRDMAEVLDRARTGAQTAMRAVTRSEVREFVSESTGQLRRLGQGLASLGAERGPLGQFVRQMSLSSQIGGLAFIPEGLRGTAMVASEVSSQIQNTVNAFTSFDGILGVVTGGIGLFVTRIGQLMGGRDGMGFGAAFESAAAEFATYAIDFVDTIEETLIGGLETFAGINWDSVFGDESGEGPTTAFGRLWERIGDVDWDRILSLLSDGWKALTDRFTVFLPPIQKAFGEIAEGAAVALMDAIPWASIGQTLSTGLANAWESWAMPALLDSFQTGFRYLIDHAPEIIMQVGDAIVVALLVGLGLALVAGIAMLLAPLALVMGAIAVYTWAFLETHWTSITTFMGDAFRTAATVISSLWNGVVVGFTASIASFTAPWTPWLLTIQTVWATVEGIINTASARITGVITAMTGVAQGGFHGIMDTVQDLFGNSVNTVVGEDMEATHAVVTSTTDAIAAHLEETLFGATVRALTTGFANAFAQITESGEKFANDFGDKMQALADRIATLFVSMYTRIVAGAALAGLGVEQSLGTLILRLGQLADAQETLITARAAATASVAPVGDTQRAERLARMGEDLRAIHDPDWYRNDYRELFITKMNQVVSATAGNSGTRSSSGPDLAPILAALQSLAPGAPANTRQSGTRGPARRR